MIIQKYKETEIKLNRKPIKMDKLTQRQNITLNLNYILKIIKFFQNDWPDFKWV